MGTFLGYFGDKTIPEDKREEFNQRVLTILDQGGIMDQEMICLLGRRLWLLTPPQAMPGLDTILFCYNYFEHDTWETGGYNPLLCSFSTNKVGWRQFNRVCSAVYVLYEFYTQTFGIASEDAHVFDAREIIGWLNHLFGSGYDNSRISNPWRIYQLLPDYRQDDNLLTLPNEGVTMDPLGVLTYLTVTRHINAEGWQRVMELSSDAPHTIPDCIRRVDRALAKLTAEDKVPDLNKLEQLMNSLKTRDLDLLTDDAQTCFAVMAVMLPVEIAAKLLADAFSQDFESLLEEMRPFDWDGASAWNFEGLPPSKPVAPVDTNDFLGCSDDDRIPWWTPDGDIHFSDEMNTWLAQCRSELEAMARDGATLNRSELPALLVRTLDDLEKRTPAEYAFREMFYDFMAHAESPMVQAAVRFLHRMSEQGQEINVPLRRYLAVLGNLSLREKAFGF